MAATNNKGTLTFAAISGADIQFTICAYLPQMNAPSLVDLTNNILLVTAGQLASKIKINVVDSNEVETGWQEYPINK